MDPLATRKLVVTFETAEQWYLSQDSALNDLAKELFPELKEREIPNGTKVWYKERNNDDDVWQYGYYSEFRLGHHFISTNSRLDKIVSVVTTVDPLEDILPK